MTYETIKLVIDERGVATLTLARPDKHNAINSQLIREMRHVLASITENKKIRVLVLAGEGKSFCAGADLGWMKDQFDATREQRISEAQELAGMLADINDMALPVIARINGQAYGGGIGVMCVADIVIAVDNGKFGLTEVRLGIIPATISPFVIARMGEGNARQVFFSGRIFGADEAKDLGLVSRICSAEELDEAIEAEIKPFLSASPSAIARSKNLIKELSPRPSRTQIGFTIEQLADTWETDDAVEGIEAFFAKRKPGWAKD